MVTTEEKTISKRKQPPLIFNSGAIFPTTYLDGTDEEDGLKTVFMSVVITKEEFVEMYNRWILGEDDLK